MSSRPFSERRHFQAHNIETVVKILPKSSLADRLLQILVRRRDEPDVHLDRSRAADAFKFAFLQHAQQFHLERRREFTDLIKKHRAAIGDFQPPFLLRRARR